MTIFTITKLNAFTIMRGGRARWKVENETFNTLRNTTDDPITVDISVHADDLGLPAISLVASALLGETLYPLNGSGSTRTMSVTLAPQASEILCLMSGSFVYLPLVLNVP